MHNLICDCVCSTIQKSISQILVHTSNFTFDFNLQPAIFSRLSNLEVILEFRGITRQILEEINFKFLRG